LVKLSPSKFIPQPLVSSSSNFQHACDYGQTMSINWPRFVEGIKAHKKFLLVSHIRPDCDALGSELGMAAILDKLGKRVRIVNGQATPPNYEFIDPQRRIT